MPLGNVHARVVEDQLIISTIWSWGRQYIFIFRQECTHMCAHPLRGSNNIFRVSHIHALEKFLFIVFLLCRHQESNNKFSLQLAKIKASPEWWFEIFSMFTTHHMTRKQHANSCRHYFFMWGKAMGGTAVSTGACVPCGLAACPRLQKSLQQHPG